MFHEYVMLIERGVCFFEILPLLHLSLTTVRGLVFWPTFTDSLALCFLKVSIVKFVLFALLVFLLRIHHRDKCLPELLRSLNINILNTTT